MLLGDGLKAIGRGCFSQSGLEEIVIPRNVALIGCRAFEKCERLRRVSFAGNALETIEERAFFGSGLESFVAPASLRRIGDVAFKNCENLRRADLSACALQTDLTHKQGSWFKCVFENSGLESVKLSPALRVVSERMFVGCERLASVSFGEDSQLCEIQAQAFKGCGLRSFVAPPLLQKIGDMAFGGCALKTLKLNRAVRELGWMCFWGTTAFHPKIPSVGKTRKQLGLCQKPGVLRLPDGLSHVGSEWFKGTGVRRVVVPSSVGTMGNEAFGDCAQLCELVFEPGSTLRYVGSCCFCGCGFRALAFPGSLKAVGDMAFCECQSLCSLHFPDDGELCYVGYHAFRDTQLTPERVNFPDRLKGETCRHVW